MTILSRRTKEAIKTGLAIVIVYWIAMEMGWDKPYWAGITVVTINIMSAGVTLVRGVARSLGTLVGAVAGVALICLFPQERWWAMAGLSLWVGFCTYMLKGKSQSYFWFLAAMTCVVIVGVSSPPDSATVFQTAILRTQETAMGAVVYLVVAVFVWPQNTVGAFDEASRKLSATQARLFRTYLDQMSGKGAAEDSRPLRLQEIQLLAQVGKLLSAAESDSYAVWEVRHQWRRFLDQSTALMEALERWRESFTELKSLDVTGLLPNLAEMGVELDRRFDRIEGMLNGKAPDGPPTPMTLTVDRAEMRALARFEEAAVVVTKTQLDRIDALSRSLFDCVADIGGYARPAAAAAAPEPAGLRGLAFDPDRVAAAAMVVATMWIAFLIWVYVNPPGHSAYPMMATIFALIVALVPTASPILLFLSWGGGIAFAGVLYVFVLPHLSGFAELAAFLFAAFFVMHYLLAAPRLTIARFFAMVSFLIVIGIDNQQSYSFSQYANDAIWILLSLTLAVVVAAVTISPRPEKAFLRLLRRYFLQAEFVMARLALNWDQEHGLAGRLKTAFARNDLLELPAKLAAIAPHIDYRTLSGDTPEQVQALVTSLKRWPIGSRRSTKRKVI